MDSFFHVTFDGRKVRIEKAIAGAERSTLEHDLTDAGQTVLGYVRWLQEIRRLARQERRPRAGRHPELR